MNHMVDSYEIYGDSKPDESEDEEEDDEYPYNSDALQVVNEKSSQQRRSQGNKHSSKARANKFDSIEFD